MKMAMGGNGGSKANTMIDVGLLCKEVACGRGDVMPDDDNKDNVNYNGDDGGDGAKSTNGTTMTKAKRAEEGGGALAAWGRAGRVAATTAATDRRPPPSAPVTTTPADASRGDDGGGAAATTSVNTNNDDLSCDVSSSEADDDGRGEDARVVDGRGTTTEEDGDGARGSEGGTTMDGHGEIEVGGGGRGGREERNDLSRRAASTSTTVGTIDVSTTNATTISICVDDERDDDLELFAMFLAGLRQEVAGDHTEVRFAFLHSNPPPIPLYYILLHFVLRARLPR